MDPKVKRNPAEKIRVRKMVSFTLSDASRKRLTELAKAFGLSKSATIDRLVLAASRLSLHSAPAPPKRGGARAQNDRILREIATIERALDAAKELRALLEPRPQDLPKARRRERRA